MALAHRPRPHPAAEGDPGPVWAELREGMAGSPQSAGAVAADLALLGDAQHAAELGAALPARSPDRALLDGVLAWRSGDVEGAKARLRAVDAVTPIIPAGTFNGLPPSYVLAEIAAASGHDAEVIAAVDRLRTLWSHLASHAWILPRASFLRARAQARLGRGEDARRGLDQLLAQLQRADPDVPLVAEARALRATLDGDEDPR